MWCECCSDRHRFWDHPGIVSVFRFWFLSWFFVCVCHVLWCMFILLLLFSLTFFLPTALHVVFRLQNLLDSLHLESRPSDKFPSSFLFVPVCVWEGLSGCFMYLFLTLSSLFHHSIPSTFYFFVQFFHFFHCIKIF